MAAPYSGKFLWYELMTSDVKAAEVFYTKVVGWSARDAGMPEPYTMFTLGKGEDAIPVGGLMGTPPEAKAAGAPPAWTGYIGVEDVDAAARRIDGAGGKTIVPPTDIPHVGRFAIMLDPQGAAFALFKPGSEPPANVPAPGTPGTVGWHELMAADGPKAVEFYTSMFGWKKGEAMDMGPNGVYQIFELNGQQLGGIMTKPAAIPVPNWGYYINVDEIHAAIKRVNEAGGQVINGPMEVPGGSWIINGIDPQGAHFSLVAPGAKK
jgi:predicted enzyme related to lactoylglutathione lyase